MEERGSWCDRGVGHSVRCTSGDARLVVLSGTRDTHSVSFPWLGDPGCTGDGWDRTPVTEHSRPDAETEDLGTTGPRTVVYSVGVVCPYPPFT